MPRLESFPSQATSQPYFIGRLESVLSRQVVHPFLNEPFPVVTTTALHDDRIFRHITFLESNSTLNIRLRAVDHNYMTSSIVSRKSVSTPWPFDETTLQNVFRVKAVLSQAENGIQESYWVTNKSTEKSLASTHNQFRIRGVSKENWRSDWVYSELKDFDNDLIIYNMLYDILDLLSSLHDDQIEYLMDYIVTDTFIKVITEKLPQLATNLDPDELKDFSLLELITVLSEQTGVDPKENFVSQLGDQFLVLSDELKREFKENILASPEEFATLYRVYHLLDQYNQKKQDVLGLLIEIFLEDRLEKVVQKTNIEAMLQNDEEIGMYLNGTYEFSIKSELITSAYDASPDEHFVTCINDAVQLMSEPVVLEELRYGKAEEVAKFLRLAIEELYIPFVAIDQRLIELEHDLNDVYDSKSVGTLVEFSLLEGDFSSRYLFIYDVIEALIKNDNQLEQQYEAVFIEHLLNTVIDSRKALLIDYHLDEFLNVLVNMGDSFTQAYTNAFHPVVEHQSAFPIDLVSKQEIKNLTHLFEHYQAIYQDYAQLSSVKAIRPITEQTHISFIEQILQQYKVFKQIVQETLSTSSEDQANSKEIKGFLQRNEQIRTQAIDDALLRDVYAFLNPKETMQTSIQNQMEQVPLSIVFTWLEQKQLISEDMYFNLFEHHLREPNRYPLLENLYTELAHDLRDKYIMDSEELVEYLLGDIGYDWPVGVLTLGTNTLKG